MKYEDAPRLTRSMHVALQDLGLDHLWVICPDGQPHPLADRVTVVPLSLLGGALRG